MNNVIEFRAGLEICFRGILPFDPPTRPHFALQLLYDYTALSGTEFDKKYPAFVESICAFAFEDPDCECSEQEIIKWGLGHEV